MAVGFLPTHYVYWSTFVVTVGQQKKYTNEWKGKCNKSTSQGFCLCKCHRKLKFFGLLFTFQKIIHFHRFWCKSSWLESLESSYIMWFSCSYLTLSFLFFNTLTLPTKTLKQVKCSWKQTQCWRSSARCYYFKIWSRLNDTSKLQLGHLGCENGQMAKDIYPQKHCNQPSKLVSVKL